MKLVLGRPIISFLVERASSVPSVNRVIVATTDCRDDDVLVEYCEKRGVEVFRGNNSDVLNRIYNCVKDFGEEYIIKLWGDSPLIDPFIIQQMVDTLESDCFGCDYLSNNHPSTYPEGMQVELIKIAAIKTAALASDLTDYDREHVSTYIWQRPDRFNLGNIVLPQNLQPLYRICLDYPEDFAQLQQMIEALYPGDPLFGMDAMVEFLDNHPEVKAINFNRYEDTAAYYERIRLPGPRV